MQEKDYTDEEFNAALKLAKFFSETVKPDDAEYLKIVVNGALLGLKSYREDRINKTQSFWIK